MANRDRELLLVRHRRWFKPHVSVDELEPFPTDQVDTLTVTRPGTWDAKFIIGRGPAQIPLVDSIHLYFEHGEQEYPVFSIPSVGPSGAALMSRKRVRSIEAGEDEAILLMDAAALAAIPDAYGTDRDVTPSLDLFVDLSTPQGQFALGTLDELEYTTAMLAGSYALYQYPLVWTPLETDRLVALLPLARDLEKFPNGTLRVDAKYVETPDNWIPFELNPVAEISAGHLTDSVASNWSALSAASDRLRGALVGLEKAMYRRGVDSRFLQLFWILDHLSSESGEPDPSFREAIEALERLVVDSHQELIEPWMRMKERSLQPSMKERIIAYTTELGVNIEEELVRQIVNTRNDLSHGRRPDPHELADIELKTRQLIWELLQAEMETAGIQLGPGQRRSVPD